LERKGKQNKKPLGEFFPQGFLSTGNRALKFLFPLVVKKPLGKIFSQGVFIALLLLRNPQGRQHLELLPALWISRNFVKKKKKRGKYLFESVESIRIVFSIKG